MLFHYIEILTLSVVGTILSTERFEESELDKVFFCSSGPNRKRIEYESSDYILSTIHKSSADDTDGRIIKTLICCELNQFNQADVRRYV